MPVEAFVIRALLAGIGVAIVAAPLGCFVVWRRMAYFGDTMAHSALLGVALGIASGVSLNLAVAVITILVALLLVLLQRCHGYLAADTILGVLAHSSLALGLLAVALMTWLRVDLVAYLFGDVLAVTKQDLIVIWVGGAAILVAMAALWRSLVAITVHEDLARAEGIRAEQVRLAYLLLLAIFIALSIKVVGILLVTSLLIIPAAVARRFARSPEAMAIGAMATGVLAVIIGISTSMVVDTPSGPSIVTAAAALFALTMIVPSRWTSRRKQG